MNIQKFEDMGITLHLPDEFENTKGSFSGMPFGNQNNELFIMAFIYMAMSEEDVKKYHELVEKNPQDPAAAKILGALGNLLSVFGITENRGPEDIVRLLKTENMKAEMFTEVGQAGDIRYFAYSNPANDESFLARQEPRFAEEFYALKKSLVDVLKQAEYYTPVIPGSDLIGKTLSFETKDIDGNIIKSEELFAAHAVTMINVWATWCAPCKSELKDLANIHRNLVDKNAAIVGFCIDADEKPEECRNLIQQNNITYLNLLRYDAFNHDLPFDSIPTSVFVNSEGTIMTYPVIGVPADTSKYENIIDKLLDTVKEGKSLTQASSDRKDTGSAYLLKINDTDGAPVEGVRVRFCSDETCMMGTTDVSGKASFAAQQGHYTLHVMKVPEGYVLPEEEFAVPETYGEVEITLQKG